MNTSDLDLGNLSALKVGDLCVTVFDERPQGRGICLSEPQVVAAIEPDRILVTRDDLNGRTVGSFEPQTGKTRVYMGGPMFYLSANPAHVALAVECRDKARAERKASDADRRARRELATPIGDALATDDSRLVTEILADRLTKEQIQTLAGWLNVE